MTLYDYRCPNCELVFEVEHSIDESPEVFCPECSKDGHDDKCTRLIGRGTFFVLKGGGWARDGYSKKTGDSS